jgi:hypothetical protein
MPNPDWNVPAQGAVIAGRDHAVTVEPMIQYEVISNFLLQLYASDDVTDSLASIFDIQLLCGVPVADLTDLFPVGDDIVHLALDVESFAQRETLLAKFEAIAQLRPGSVLESVWRPLDTDAVPAWVGYGVTVSPLATATVLASVTEPSAGRGLACALVVLADVHGDAELIVRADVPADDEHGRIRMYHGVEDVVRTLAQATCGRV